MVLTGVAILSMATTVFPRVVFAVDPVVDAQNNAVVVFVVIVLLFGSVTAGLFFASPLRRRLGPALDSLPEEPAADGFGTDQDAEPVLVWHAWPAPGRNGADPRRALTQQAPSEQPMPASTAPAAPSRPGGPRPSAAIATPGVPGPRSVRAHAPAAALWSTNRPQADANWKPRTP